MIDFFKKLLGKRACFDMAHRLAYSYDATRNLILPDGVLFPKNKFEISKILKYSNEFKIPITPRGAGSGFSGGSINKGLILSLERMDKIISLDKKNLLIKVEPGVINYDLQKFVESNNLFYPPDPASEKFCTIGGNVAENAGGMRAAKYGVTKDFIASLGIVLANGDIIKIGKETPKDVAGFNLSSLICGSEGTLGVIYEITLKLLAKKKFKKSLIGFFDDKAKAMMAVSKAFYKGFDPLALEFLDKNTIKAINLKFKSNLDANCILIGAIDSDEEEILNKKVSNLGDLFIKNGAKRVKIAKNEDEEKYIWDIRRNCSQSITALNNKKLNEDISVPRSKLVEFLDEIDKISSKFDVLICCFGHAGDGNVHTNVMVDKFDKLNYKNGLKAIKEIFKTTIKLGGTITGEHGIGLSKAKFMKFQFSKNEIELFRSIKYAFDKNNILNPNKMGL